MAKLTDTQLVVLSKAVARDDGAAVVPPKLNGAGAAKVGSSLVARKLMREVRSKPGMPIWREGEDGRSISLIITRSGRDAIGVEDDAGEPDQPLVSKLQESQGSARKKKVDAESHERQTTSAAPRSGSKQALVVSMLSKEKGVTINALVEATGWLPHTTRAALTGLRKRGFVVERSWDEKMGSIYRITSHPNSAAA